MNDYGGNAVVEADDADAIAGTEEGPPWAL